LIARWAFFKQKEWNLRFEILTAVDVKMVVCCVRWQDVWFVTSRKILMLDGLWLESVGRVVQWKETFWEDEDEVVTLKVKNLETSGQL
jgi:hypothetical protein